MVIARKYINCQPNKHDSLANSAVEIESWNILTEEAEQQQSVTEQQAGEATGEQLDSAEQKAEGEKPAEGEEQVLAETSGTTEQKQDETAVEGINSRKKL